MIAHRSASSFTAYPACTDDAFDPLTATAVPPGHSTISPPITSTRPPNQHPPDQRIDRESEDRLLGAVHQTSEHDVQIHAQPAHDADLCRGFKSVIAEGVDVLALFVRSRPMALPSRRTSSSAAVTWAIERVVLRDAEMGERIKVTVAAFQLGRFAGTKRGFGFGLERHSCEADEEQHDAMCTMY